jgi:hypothetical protein
MILSSCSSPTLVLDRRASAKDRAALYHAVQDKEVVVTTLRDSTGPRQVFRAREFSLDLDSARFLDVRSNTRRSISTTQVASIDCAECSRSYIGTGTAIGAGSGLLIGALVGAGVDASSKAMASLGNALSTLSLQQRYYEPPPSVVPLSLLVGVLIGGGLGAASSAGAYQPSTTWILQD